MERNRRYFSGHTLQQALTRAASHYGCAPEALNWKEVEKRHGFLKVRRGVIVEIDPDEPVRAPGDAPATSPAAAPSESPTAADRPQERVAEPEPVVEDVASEPAAATAPEAPDEPDDASGRPWWAMPPAASQGEGESEPATDSRAPESEATEPPRKRSRGGRSRRRRGGRQQGGSEGGAELTELREFPASPGERWPEASGARAESARRWVGELLSLAGLELEIGLYDMGEELLVELTGKHRELVVADRGRVLLAIQHLLPRLMRADLGETPSLRVDSESFQDIREETLRDLAQRAADRVRENRRPWLLEPMAPDERRIVHLTLADDPAVTTESLGEGYFKRVRVQPERGSGRGR